MLISISKTIYHATYLELDGCQVPIKNKLSLLGFTLDNKLNMNLQINKIASKCSPLIYSFRKIRHYLTTEQSLLLYTSFIRPNLEYCSSLFLGLPTSTIALIEKIENIAIRIIYREPPGTTFSISAARSSLSIKTLQERRIEHLNKIVKNALKEPNSPLLPLLQTCRSHYRNLRSGARCPWILPRPSSTYGSRRFTFLAVRMLKL